jgi:Spy/CpxP family protein refolding chaperone
MPIEMLVAAFPESRAVKALYQNLVPDRFRSYMITVWVAANKPGIDAELMLHKTLTGQKLDLDEQEAWDQGARNIAWYNLWSSQLQLTRYRPQKMQEMRELHAQTAEDVLGIPAQTVLDANSRGENLNDYLNLDPLQRRLLMAHKPEQRFWGLTVGLQPVTQQAERLIYNEYQRAREQIIEKARVSGFVSERGEVVPSYAQLEQQLRAGELRPEDYRYRVADTQQAMIQRIRSLKEDNERYKDVPTTREELMDYFKRTGREWYDHPMDAVLQEYFNIRVEMRKDPETGKMEPDWEKYFRQREMFELLLTDEQRAKLDAFMQMEDTPMRKVLRADTQEYLRMYQNVPKAVEKSLDEESRRLVQRYLDADDSTRRAMLQEETAGPKIKAYLDAVSTGRKNLRASFPLLDAKLLFWGVVSAPQTPKAIELLDSLYKDLGIKRR